MNLRECSFSDETSGASDAEQSSSGDQNMQTEPSGEQNMQTEPESEPSVEQNMQTDQTTKENSDGAENDKGKIYVLFRYVFCSFWYYQMCICVEFV